MQIGHELHFLSNLTFDINRLNGPQTARSEQSEHFPRLRYEIGIAASEAFVRVAGRGAGWEC